MDLINIVFTDKAYLGLQGCYLNNSCLSKTEAGMTITTTATVIYRKTQRCHESELRCMQLKFFVKLVLDANGPLFDN